MEELLDLAVEGLISNTELADALLIINSIPPEPIRIRSDKFGRFDIDEWTDEECMLFFRFEKNDIEDLVQLLNIPEEIKTSDRHSTTGLEGLCILLRRLAYPNRLFDLQPLFGLSSPYISRISNSVLKIILNNKEHLIDDLRNLQWLSEGRMQYYSNAIARRGAPIHNCWGFIDGTCRPICRPGIDQRSYYSGHKKFHCLKYQGIVCPDGIIVSLSGPFHGQRHDAGVLQMSHIYEQLQAKAKFGADSTFVIYGDTAYPMRELICRPYQRRNATRIQANFNKSMSSVREAIEWSFGKVTRTFAFVDFKKNQKILLQSVPEMYKAAVILTNCHTCLYSSQTTLYFDVDPPTLQEYLS